MRTSSFSNERVIGVVSRYFIPVWLSVDDYGTQKSPADRAEWERIQKAAHGGNINVYVIASDGTPLGRMNVTQALNAEKNLLPFLDGIVTEQKLPSRKDAAVRASTANFDLPPKPHAVGNQVFHLWTTGERGRAEDWFQLSATDAASFAPPARVMASSSWDIPSDACKRLFLHFYPPTCNYRAEKGEVLSAELQAMATSVTPDRVCLVLKGQMRLKHDATPTGSMPAEIRANVVGAATFDRQRQAFVALQLATDHAEHTWSWQGKPAKTPVAFAVELVGLAEAK
ncbi:MAG: hypothetical protein K2R98_34055 [Gemmataceae bacterium]|nr:hypothetical protein [Gemmataceae bacterium]